MRKIIVTGFSGFVSRHFLDYLYESHTEATILGLDIAEPKFDLTAYQDRLSIGFRSVNLMEEESVTEILQEFCPDEILHLAAFSSVTFSWQHPGSCFHNNTRVFLSVAEAVRKLHLPTRILSVGSSEVYGNIDEKQLPLREECAIHPLSPYAIARQAQEQLSQVYTEHFGVNLILTRSFNHIGPRQDERFVIPSFISRALAVKEAGKTEGNIETGDISLTRDFLDVRDVVRAYDCLLQQGKAGRIYNVCSGTEKPLSALLKEIGDILGIRLEGVVNSDLVRPTDNRRVVGINERIKQDTGWEPQIPLRQTLEDMIHYMESARNNQ